MKVAFSLLLGMIVWLISPCATAQPNDELRRILATLQQTATSEQYRMFEQAINASPQLTAQLNELAATRQLTAIEIGERSALPRAGSEFSAYVSGTTWAFTPQFVQQQAKQRYMDVVAPDDMSGNNMVFALGELAYNTKYAPQVAAAQAALNDEVQRQIKQSPTHFDATSVMQRAVGLHISNTALGFIQGWNDMLDAAMQENGSNPLTVRQTVSLLMNFRYRAVFVRALHAAHPLRFENDGRIASTNANRDVLTDAFRSMPLYDLQ